MLPPQVAFRPIVDDLDDREQKACVLVMEDYSNGWISWI
jgi:hypothetical protein